jgi:hypothetical protein
MRLRQTNRDGSGKQEGESHRQNLPGQYFPEERILFDVFVETKAAIFLYTSVVAEIILFLI